MAEFPADTPLVTQVHRQPAVPDDEIVGPIGPEMLDMLVKNADLVRGQFIGRYDGPDDSIRFRSLLGKLTGGRIPAAIRYLLQVIEIGKAKMGIPPVAMQAQGKTHVILVKSGIVYPVVDLILVVDGLLVGNPGHPFKSVLRTGQHL